MSMLGSKFSKILKVFKNMDFFGVKINFRIDEDWNHTTICGGCTSLIFFILATIYIIVNLVSFINRENMSLIFINKILKTNPKVNLTENKVIFALGLTHEYGSYPSYENFEFSLDLVKWIGVDIFIKESIPLVACKYENFRSIPADIYELNGLDSCLCTDLNQVDNFTIAGLYTDDWYQYLEINVKLRKNFTDNYYQIEKELLADPLIFQIFFPDTSVDYDNLESPLPKYLNYFLTSVNLAYYKSAEIYLSDVQFSSDDNFIFSNQYSYKVSMLDKSVEFSQIIKNRMDPEQKYNAELLKMRISASPKFFILTRAYQKLPDFLANLSGILSQFLFLVMVFTNFHNENCAHQKIISKVTKYKGKENFDVKFLTNVFKKNPQVKKRGNIENPDSEAITYEKNELKTFKSQTSYKLLENYKLSNPENKQNNRINNNGGQIIEANEKIKEIKLSDDLTSQYTTNKIIKFQESKGTPRSSKTNINSLDIIFIKLNCCCKKLRNKKKILSAGEEKLYLYLDVTTYLKKMQEFDTTKYILLNRDQRHLIGFLSLPLLSAKDIKNPIYKEFISEQKGHLTLSKQEMKNVRSCYNNIQNEIPTTDLNKKLLSLVDAEIENVKN
jgi:hypothetical protein